MVEFDHEKLDVYQAGVEFVILADGMVRTLPKGRAYLADQLRRGASSVVLNIAEGAGEYRPKDKARFYRMALRSGTECAALLDLCTRLELIDATAALAGRELLLRIVSMLAKLVLKLREQRERERERKRGRD